MQDRWWKITLLLKPWWKRKFWCQKMKTIMYISTPCSALGQKSTFTHSAEFWPLWKEFSNDMGIKIDHLVAQWANNLISQTVQFQNVTKKDGAKSVPFFLEIWNNFLLTAASEREVSQALSKKKSYSGLILRAYSYGLYQESCSFKHPGLNSPQKFLLNNLVYLKFWKP